VYHRLAAEIAELESRGVGQRQKWIPKGPAKIVKSPSTEAALANPPWQQEQARLRWRVLRAGVPELLACAEFAPMFVPRRRCMSGW
jgi:hypothetical protein